jgi:hypothetical protein
MPPYHSPDPSSGSSSPHPPPPLLPTKVGQVLSDILQRNIFIRFQIQSPSTSQSGNPKSTTLNPSRHPTPPATLTHHDLPPSFTPMPPPPLQPPPSHHHLLIPPPPLPPLLPSPVKSDESESVTRHFNQTDQHQKPHQHHRHQHQPLFLANHLHQLRAVENLQATPTI